MCIWKIWRKEDARSAFWRESPEMLYCFGQQLFAYNPCKGLNILILQPIFTLYPFVMLLHGKRCVRKRKMSLGKYKSRCAWKVTIFVKTNDKKSYLNFFFSPCLWNNRINCVGECNRCIVDVISPLFPKWKLFRVLREVTVRPVVVKLRP